MSFDLSDLYQDVILDHYRNPRGAGVLTNATHAAMADNPICGDRVSVTARIDQGIIEEIKHDSLGCALCVASASLMVEMVKGKSVGEFAGNARNFYSFVKGENAEMEGKLLAFAGVSKFPMRVKCATLAWHTLESAISDYDGK